VFKGRKIGEIHLGSIAVLYVGARHWYRRGNGYSIDAGLADELVEREIDELQFLTTETKKSSRIPLATFLMHAERLPDTGWGQKLVCSSFYYNGHAAAAPAPSLVQQLRLFPGSEGVGNAAA